VTAGDRVEVAHLGLRGDVLSVDDATASVQAGAVTVKVPLQAIRVLQRGASPSRPEGSRRVYPGRSSIRTPGKSAVATEMNLIGRTTDEARDLLEKYLDDAFLAGLTSVRIIHGKGTGALRRAVEDVLSSHPLVTAHRPGAPSEGGGGATVATLSQS
jgi:DNA mismatch repair protein MutS2